MGKWVHRLTDVNLEACTAVCAVDGPVSIYVSGTLRRCSVALATSAPGPGDRPKTGHRLLSKDPETRTGVCQICGPVGLRIKKGSLRCENTRYNGEQLKLRDATKRALREGKTCEICGGSGQVLDHRHGTKTWRGVLCHKHNTGLGMFDDDPKLLQAALDYLQTYE